MNEIQNNIRQWVIRQLTKKLLKAITEDDILRIVNRNFYVGKYQLSVEEASVIKEEARNFSESFLWKMMARDVQYIAFLTMAQRAKSPEDIIFGKAMMYNLDILKNFLEKIKSL